MDTIVWNKGLTKETDSRLGKMAMNASRNFKGLTEKQRDALKLGPKSRQKRENRGLETCDYCGNEFFEAPCRKNVPHKHNFCSEKCYGDWKTANGTVLVNCDWCGESIRAQNRRYNEFSNHFCSRECSSRYHTGERSNNWKGGYEPYYGPNWYKQRGKCLRRDDRTCKRCGLEKNGREHDVHHIIPFRDFGIENYKAANDLDNLVTLCNKCHGIEEVSS